MQIINFVLIWFSKIIFLQLFTMNTAAKQINFSRFKILIQAKRKLKTGLIKYLIMIKNKYYFDYYIHC